MNIKQLIKNEKGLTLVEVIASVLILSLVTISLYGIYDYSINSYRWGGEYASNQEEGRFVMDKVTKIVKNGFDVDTLPDNQHLVIYSDGIFRLQPRLKTESLTHWKKATTVGEIYESPAPFALIKPTVKGNLQAAVEVNPEKLQGSSGILYFAAPKTLEDGRIAPDENNRIEIVFTGNGATLINRVDGTILEEVGLPVAGKFTVSVKPKTYDSTYKYVTVTVNGKTPGNGPALFGGSTKPPQWKEERSVAFVGFGVEGSASLAEVWDSLIIYYNTYKIYLDKGSLYYQENEKEATEVAERVYGFEFVEFSNLVDLKMIFKGEDVKGGNPTYEVSSSVYYMGR